MARFKWKSDVDSTSFEAWGTVYKMSKRSGVFPRPGIEADTKDVDANDESYFHSKEEVDAVFQNPLSEETLKSRRVLLAVSFVIFVMVETQILPTKLAFLGVEFEESNAFILLRVLGILNVYFWLTFLLFGQLDYVGKRYRSGVIYQLYKWPPRVSVLLLLRELFGLVLPLIFGLYTSFLSFTYGLS